MINIPFILLFVFFQLVQVVQASEQLAVQVGSGMLQSNRPYQEDRIVPCEYVENGVISCVCDGHGGSEVSGYLKNHVVPEYCRCLYAMPEEPKEKVWQQVFTNLDANVCAHPFWTSGSTAVVAHIDLKTNKLHLLAVGDSMGYAFNDTGLLKGQNDKLMKVGEASDIMKGVNANNIQKCCNSNLISIEKTHIIRKIEPGMLFKATAWCYITSLKFLHPVLRRSPKCVYRNLSKLYGWFSTEAYGLNMGTSIGDKFMQIPGKERFQQPVTPLAEIQSMDLPKDPFHILLCSDGVSDVIPDPVSWINELKDNSPFDNNFAAKCLSKCEIKDSAVGDNKALVLLSIIPNKLSEFIACKMQEKNKRQTWNKIIGGMTTLGLFALFFLHTF